MTCLLSPESEFEGGDLELMAEGKIAKIKQGHAIFFASFIRHRVAPVTRGNRKSLVMWFGGTPFQMMIKASYFPTIIYAKDVNLDNRLFERSY